MTAVKFPDISRFSRQVVTLYIAISNPNLNRLALVKTKPKPARIAYMHMCKCISQHNTVLII